MKKALIVITIFCILVIKNITCHMAYNNHDTYGTCGRLGEATSLAHQTGVDKSTITKKILDSEDVGQIIIVNLRTLKITLLKIYFFIAALFFIYSFCVLGWKLTFGHFTAAVVIGYFWPLSCIVIIVVAGMYARDGLR